MAWLRGEDRRAAAAQLAQGRQSRHMSISERTDESDDLSSVEPGSPIRMVRSESNLLQQSALGKWYEHRLQVFLDMGWYREEVRLALILVLTMMIGVTCTYSAYLIPYFWSEVVGMVAVVAASLVFMVLTQRRVRVLEMMPVSVPPGLLALFLNYVSLAESVDKDGYSLKTEDALEVAVETNVYDR